MGLSGFKLKGARFFCGTAALAMVALASGQAEAKATRMREAVSMTQARA